MQFENTTDEEIIELYHKQARSMSFYNAAEGQAWYSERTARDICGGEFRKTKEELKRRGIEQPTGDYLI